MNLQKVCPIRVDLGYSLSSVGGAMQWPQLLRAVQAVDRVNITEQFKEGDRTAFLAVYDEHADRIRRLVRRFFPGRIEQEDAAQEVWLVVYRMRQSYQLERGPLGAWLMVIAANRCRQMLRDQGRRPSSAIELDESEMENPTSQPDPLPSQSREALAHFAASLTSQEAAFLRLAFVEELTNPELARALKISERRCKYLRKKLLLRAADDPAIRALMQDDHL